jgi:putative transposase
MMQGNVFRIYPDDDQKTLIEKHISSCRFIYNRFLHIKKVFYEKFRIDVSLLELEKYLPMFKEIYPWLKEVNSQSLQQARKNLQDAYSRYFKGQNGFPKWKTKKDNNKSFQIPQRYRLNLTSSKVFLPGIGWMKIKMHRDMFIPEFLENLIETTEVNGEVIVEKDLNAEFLRTATVRRTPTGKYYISILMEDREEYPEIQEYSEDTTVGIDLGIKDFAIISTGEKIANPKFLKTSLSRLKTFQRRVSRKLKGSNNRRKAVKQLAKIHEKISNQRHDFQHKESNTLLSENQAVAVETLNIKGMTKNHKLAQAISDSAWGSFVSKLEYKAKRLGKTVLRIGMWEPSTKTCNVCGYHNQDITLDVREWECPDCRTVHDRDINAAINIKKFALTT